MVVPKRQNGDSVGFRLKIIFLFGFAYILSTIYSPISADFDQDKDGFEEKEKIIIPVNLYGPNNQMMGLRESLFLAPGLAKSCPTGRTNFWLDPTLVRPILF